MKQQEIFRQLQTVKGLRPLAYLQDEHKKFIELHEQKNNIGVLDSLKRKFTLLLAHDSSFRSPVTPIVQEYASEIFFPGVAFPEVKAKNVVSSSPSKKVHKLLAKEFNLSLEKDEATLLIGFDL